MIFSSANMLVFLTLTSMATGRCERSLKISRMIFMIWKGLILLFPVLRCSSVSKIVCLELTYLYHVGPNTQKRQLADHLSLHSSPSTGVETISLDEDIDNCSTEYMLDCMVSSSCVTFCSCLKVPC